jgi:hypothetical protein
VLPRKDLLQIIVEYSQFCAFAEDITTIPEIKKGSVQWGNVNNDGLPSGFY